MEMIVEQIYSYYLKIQTIEIILTNSPSTTMNQLKMSQALLDTAETVVKIAKESGITITIFDVYHKDTIKDIAVIAGMLKTMAEKASKQIIEITNN